MRVLALETATAHASVAVLGPQGILAEHSASVTGGHLEWLMGAISSVLADAGLAAADIDALVASMGPGGFMGLRVGLITASTWAMTMSRPIIGVSTLEVIAASARDPAESSTALVLAAIDARRGEVAAALFRCGPPATAAVPERLTPDLVVAPSEIRARLPALTDEVILAGDALERYQVELIESLAPRAVPAARERW
ncbi:MAG TPA: tRNA (adenosine(37)-N6)-threonylcarbamoyltransferase complex dimerization subunit type 1 TsaB, partial [bacterium]|nr:tRNA (adenosine(37)-N6)-threonylcarbamoyltransferase complex dimerization subunit type 1 TsaB [bacterium]